jgi:hypothetical protein
MNKKLLIVALSIAVAIGFTGVSYAKGSDDIDFTTVKEDKVVKVEVPAYAEASGNVYRNKLVKQELSYEKYDAGDYYTYEITRKLTVSRQDAKDLGVNAAISCKYGAFDRYSGETIIFGGDSGDDVISASESGVGVPVYLADVTVDGKVYTLSAYQIKATSFERKLFGDYCSTTVEVVNVPKDYDGFAIVTYGLDDDEYQKASEHEANSTGDKSNIYTEVSPYVDSSHIAYYVFQ